MRDVSDDILVALGAITVNFNRLERTVGFLLGRVLGGETNLGILLTNDVSFGQKLSMVGALIDVSVAENLQDKVRRILRQCHAIERERNICLHSDFHEHIRESGGVRERIVNRFKGKTNRGNPDRAPVHELEQVSADSLEGLADRIQTLEYQVLDLLDEISTSPLTAPLGRVRKVDLKKAGSERAK